MVSPRRSTRIKDNNNKKKKSPSKAATATPAARRRPGRPPLDPSSSKRLLLASSKKQTVAVATSSKRGPGRPTGPLVYPSPWNGLNTEGLAAMHKHLKGGSGNGILLPGKIRIRKDSIKNYTLPPGTHLGLPYEQCVNFYHRPVVPNDHKKVLKLIERFAWCALGDGSKFDFKKSKKTNEKNMKGIINIAVAISTQNLNKFDFHAFFDRVAKLTKNGTSLASFETLVNEKMNAIDEDILKDQPASEEKQSSVVNESSIDSPSALMAQSLATLTALAVQNKEKHEEHAEAFRQQTEVNRNIAKNMQIMSEKMTQLGTGLKQINEKHSALAGRVGEFEGRVGKVEGKVEGMLELMMTPRKCFNQLWEQQNNAPSPAATPVVSFVPFENGSPLVDDEGSSRFKLQPRGLFRGDSNRFAASSNPTGAYTDAATSTSTSAAGRLNAAPEGGYDDEEEDGDDDAMYHGSHWQQSPVRSKSTGFQSKSIGGSYPDAVTSSASTFATGLKSTGDNSLLSSSSAAASSNTAASNMKDDFEDEDGNEPQQSPVGTKTTGLTDKDYASKKKQATAGLTVWKKKRSFDTFEEDPDDVVKEESVEQESANVAEKAKKRLKDGSSLEISSLEMPHPSAGPKVDQYRQKILSRIPAEAAAASNPSSGLKDVSNQGTTGKRVNENNQMSKEDYEALEDADGGSEPTFEKANEDTLKRRKIVKPRLPPGSSPPTSSGKSGGNQGTTNKHMLKPAPTPPSSSSSMLPSPAVLQDRRGLLRSAGSRGTATLDPSPAVLQDRRGPATPGLSPAVLQDRRGSLRSVGEPQDRRGSRSPRSVGEPQARSLQLELEGRLAERRLEQRQQQQAQNHTQHQPPALLSQIEENGGQRRTELEESGHVHEFDTQSSSNIAAERLFAQIRELRHGRSILASSAGDGAAEDGAAVEGTVVDGASMDSAANNDDVVKEESVEQGEKETEETLTADGATEDGAVLVGAANNDDVVKEGSVEQGEQETEETLTADGATEDGAVLDVAANNNDVVEEESVEQDEQETEETGAIFGFGSAMDGAAIDGAAIESVEQGEQEIELGAERKRNNQ